ATGNLAEHPALQWHDGAAVTVVIAAENYPGTPTTGDPIDGIDSAEALPDVRVLHAGTTTNADGQVVSSGGRVLSVVARGANLDVARARAYQAVDLIKLRGSHYRTDIAAAAARGELHLASDVYPGVSQ
ncbi:MAG: phosphoribosylglycinamide synthetase C domain-containing protein, partial [Candidatus Nanopelagicales bacterium]